MVSVIWLTLILACLSASLVSANKQDERKMWKLALELQQNVTNFRTTDMCATCNSFVTALETATVAIAATEVVTVFDSFCDKVEETYAAGSWKVKLLCDAVYMYGVQNVVSELYNSREAGACAVCEAVGICWHGCSIDEYEQYSKWESPSWDQGYGMASVAGHSYEAQPQYYHQERQAGYHYGEDESHYFQAQGTKKAYGAKHYSRGPKNKYQRKPNVCKNGYFECNCGWEYEPVCCGQTAFCSCWPNPPTCEFHRKCSSSPRPGTNLCCDNADCNDPHACCVRVGTERRCVCDNGAEYDITHPPHCKVNFHDPLPCDAKCRSKRKPKSKGKGEEGNLVAAHYAKEAPYEEEDEESWSDEDPNEMIRQQQEQEPQHKAIFIQRAGIDHPVTVHHEVRSRIVEN